MSQRLPESPPEAPPPHVRRPNHWRAALSMLAHCPHCDRRRKTRRAWDEDAGCYQRTCVIFYLLLAEHSVNV